LKPGAVLAARLRNGLEVRLKEIHTTPVISSWVWYRVGSRNEGTGRTGISHWVEHMLFKGTPSFPARELDRAISRDGGYWNAFTWLDWTTFFSTMPADKADLPLRLEADRMVNSLFDPKEVEAERTVIIAERQGHENEPTFRLSEEIQAAAFRVHSYHHEIIGDMADLHSIRRDDLYDHYRRNYCPSNAVLAMAGDFHSGPMLERIRQLFGQLPRLPRPEPTIREEPPQLGERRVELQGPGETTFVEVAYRAPAAGDPDFVPMAVADSVLAGASNFNLLGDGLSNKTCRLYRRLVEGGLAASVDAGLAATIDPYLYSISLTLQPGVTPERALAALDEELDVLLQSRIRARDLEKAIKQAKALFAYSSESVTNQAYWLGSTEMFAEHTWLNTYLDRLSQVTPEMVLQVVRRRLLPRHRTVGIYRPDGATANGR
jgi:zinc protease